MTITETNILHEKAKTRKDGVYSFGTYLWAVKDNNFVAFSDYNGNCYQRMGSFNSCIGKVDRLERVKELKKWLKIQ